MYSNSPSSTSVDATLKPFSSQFLSLFGGGGADIDCFTHQFGAILCLYKQGLSKGAWTRCDLITKRSVYSEEDMNLHLKKIV